MSTGTWSTVGHAAQPAATPWLSPLAILRVLGSLKITVSLFTLGILLVLVGTLAQDEETLVQVKREYFNSWLAWVSLDVFVPQTWHAHSTKFGGGFPLPGGAAIGLALMINLIAAKTTRFSIQAKGSRLGLGLIISLLGTVLVTAVILSGHATDGLQGQPPISYEQLWLGLKLGMILLTLAVASYAVWAHSLPGLAKWVVWSVVGLMLAMSVGLFLGGESVKLDAPGLRIVWQLLQATIASSVVLVGMIVLFGKRGGNMLIHVGVALLMVGQFVFGDRQVEQRITLVEGDRSNMVYMTDELEIALIDVSGKDQNDVRALPEALIRQVVRSDGLIDDPQLPCIVKIERWMPSSTIRVLNSSDKNLATQGVGLTQEAVETQASGGAKSEINLASAYVSVLDRASHQKLGTVLLSQYVNDAQQVFRNATDRNESFEIGGKPYELALRFRREYKDYVVELKDVVRETYSGSETPRDFSSLIRIANETTGEQITEKTWMNNPIRFQGETFYQSDYIPAMLVDGRREGSGLQVVRNAGWVIPYVCCMMVMVGMVYHFSGTFVRYANRVSREQVAPDDSGRSAKSKLALCAGLAIAAAAAGYGLRGSGGGRSDVDWQTIAKLPMQHEGRVKPVDTVAANVLQSLTESTFGGLPYVKDPQGNKRPLAEWLLAVMADVPWARDAQVFRIYAKEVRDLLKLEERKGFRYSFSEVDQQRAAFFLQIDKLREKSQRHEQLDFREQKISEFYQKWTNYELLTAAYEQPAMPAIQKVESEEEIRSVMAELDKLDRRYKVIESMHPPAFIPPTASASTQSDVAAKNDSEWFAFGPARFKGILDMVRGVPANPAVDAFEQLMMAVQKQDVAQINSAARRYERVVGESAVAKPHIARASLESRLNQFNPTALGIMLYLLALMLGFLSFATKGTTARSATYGILLGVFVIHTVTLLVRMYISGRAPVTNLYSSAVFIGWACVLFCLIMERVHRLGVANIVAALIGLITLSVARSLEKGDTMHVLQAVLDTQFWLSTHVVIITAGYAVTYLAGFFGAVALVHMMITRRRRLDADGQKKSQRLQAQMYRMGYFSVCFGILFSFVGTVLGGLWADDSWGRFWGWDPKENGALMIVLWNAVVLHSRWDKLVGPRGFAILALLGNIVTSWSWFGTNLLGIGLHEYGFNTSVAVALVITVTVHLSFIAAALILTHSRQRFGSE